MAVSTLFSVLCGIVPELAKVVRVSTMPMMILSGAIIPIQALPHVYQEWLWLNPIAHGIELLRLAFFEHYRATPYLNTLYLVEWIAVSMVIGLMLHIRFQYRMKMQ